MPLLPKKTAAAEFFLRNAQGEERCVVHSAAVFPRVQRDCDLHPLALRRCKASFVHSSAMYNDVSHFPLHTHARKASAESMRIARHAGNRLARNATIAMIRNAEANAKGSRGLT